MKVPVVRPERDNYAPVSDLPCRGHLSRMGFHDGHARYRFLDSPGQNRRWGLSILNTGRRRSSTVLYSRCFVTEAYDMMGEIGARNPEENQSKAERKDRSEPSTRASGKEGGTDAPTVKRRFLGKWGKVQNTYDYRKASPFYFDTLSSSDP